MRFEHMANVTAAQLDSAATEVLEGETPESLRAGISGRNFWIDLLKARYATRFAEVNEPYFHRQNALEVDKQDMADQLHLNRSDIILRRQKEAEQRLIESLTVQIWNSVPDQVTHL
ncbi:hypothetical protein D9M69_719730 [compost metagenome]